MTEAEMVRWGLDQFLFAAKLVAGCRSGIINCNAFKPRITVNIPGDVRFEVPEWDLCNTAELSKGAENQMMIATAACSIVTDEALSRRFGSSSLKDWRQNPSDLNSLREIMRLIRSAYAHKMPDVHWRISEGRRTAVYSVHTPDGIVRLDANGKDGQKFELAHFGGLKGYFHLVYFADGLLRTGRS